MQTLHMCFSFDGAAYKLRAAIPRSTPDTGAPASSGQRAALAAHAKDTLLALAEQMIDSASAS